MNNFFCQVQGQAGIVVGEYEAFTIDLIDNFNFLSFDPEKVNAYIKVHFFIEDDGASAAQTFVDQTRANGYPVEIQLWGQTFLVAAKDGQVKIPLKTQSKQNLNSLQVNNVGNYVKITQLPAAGGAGIRQANQANDFCWVEIIIKVKNLVSE